MKNETAMTDTEKLAFLLSHLQQTADRKHCQDGEYYSPSETESYDDTFDEGADYGEVEFARWLLRELNK